VEVERFETLIKERLTKTEFYKISNDSINSKEKIQEIDRKLSELMETRNTLEYSVKKKLKKLKLNVLR
jgi:hypothetical protein